jgi:hypothetical protein
MRRVCAPAIVCLLWAIGAPAAEVVDACAECHPPLAMPAAHPALEHFDLATCRNCHVPGSGAGEALLRAMHLGHVESMGFDCTLCHVDAEPDLPDLRGALDAMLDDAEGEDDPR